MRVGLVQMEHGPSLEDNLSRARSGVEEALRRGAQLVLLPEYFFAVFPSSPQDQAALAPRVREALAEASRSLGVAVAGNAIEVHDGALHNVGLVYDEGRPVLEQSKVHPMPREVEGGLRGGIELGVAQVRGTSVGMLVCADILYPEASRILALRGARVLLNPVMSPYRAQDDTREAREALYVARAYDAGAFVLKAGGFRRPSAEDPQARGVAGRSLVAAPWGVLARYRDDFAAEVLVADLDFGRLDAFRAHQAGFPARRPEAYKALQDV